MLQAIIAFVTHLGTALVLLACFLWVYARVTPYNDFDLIGKGNEAAALTLGGAAIGFTLPLVASIYYTASLQEMCVWALITCGAQLVLFTLMRKHAGAIEQGQKAPAILLSALAVCVGLLVAVSISH